jgi:hypothetical protein
MPKTLTKLESIVASLKAVLIAIDELPTEQSDELAGMLKAIHHHVHYDEPLGVMAELDWSLRDAAVCAQIYTDITCNPID